MRATKISLATMLALGTLTCASAKTTLEEAIKGTTISGYVYGQMTSQFGADVHGNVFRTRAWMNLNTGSVGGFSVGTQAWASVGGASNETGKAFLAASGSPHDTLPVGLLAVYGNMDFTEYGSKTTLQGGKITIQTPFNDSTWDSGYGIYVSNQDIEGVKFAAQVLGAYALDDDYDNGQYIDLSTTSVLSKSSASSYDHPLYIFGVEAGGEQLAGAGIKLYAAHSTKVFDYMIMGDVSYTFSGVTLQSQIAVTDVDVEGDKFSDPLGKKGVAELRGLYNIQASYANQDLGFSAKAGFTGSFGDGYGALMNYASFNMGGQFWYDIGGSNADQNQLSGGSANGYGLNGAGGYKRKTSTASGVVTEKTDIMVIYAGVQYSGVKNLKVGLDYAYIGGNNNYRLTATASDAALSTWANNGESSEFHELSLTASYAFFDNKLTVSGLMGTTFGDVEMMRARMNVKYSF